MRTTEFINRLTLFMEANKQRLYQYACYSCGDPDMAADILQDVYLRLCEKTALHSGVGNLAGYLFRAIARECSRRRTRVYEPLSGSEIERLADVEPDSFEEEYRRISSLLAGMPEEMAEIIRLKHLGGLTFGEISEATGVPLSTAKSRYYTALERLRQLYFQSAES